LPHQANLNISKTVCSIMKVPLEKMLSNIQRVGNTTAASIPLLLSESIDEGKIKKGDRILTMAFGSGLTWGAGILTAQ
jgi:3-oxoacyl-[acyl-carrier-protein] synthase-3